MRKAELMNKAFLTKQAWSVLTRGEEQWCQMLKAKYGLSDDSPMVFKAKQDR